jgi:hypothetical protein
LNESCASITNSADCETGTLFESSIAPSVKESSVQHCGLGSSL